MADEEDEEDDASTGRLEVAAVCAREVPPGCVTKAAGTRRAGPMIVNLRRKRLEAHDRQRFSC